MFVSNQGAVTRTAYSPIKQAGDSYPRFLKRLGHKWGICQLWASFGYFDHFAILSELLVTFGNPWLTNRSFDSFFLAVFLQLCTISSNCQKCLRTGQSFSGISVPVVWGSYQPPIPRKRSPHRLAGLGTLKTSYHYRLAGPDSSRAGPWQVLRIDSFRGVGRIANFSQFWWFVTNFDRLSCYFLVVFHILSQYQPCLRGKCQFPNFQRFDRHCRRARDCPPSPGPFSNITGVRCGVYQF